MVLSGELCFLFLGLMCGFWVFRVLCVEELVGLLVFVGACLRGSGIGYRLGFCSVCGGFDLRVGFRGFGFD